MQNNAITVNTLCIIMLNKVILKTTIHRYSIARTPEKKPHTYYFYVLWQTYKRQQVIWFLRSLVGMHFHYI